MTITVIRQFDETNPNWSQDPVQNFLFLKAVRAHAIDVLMIRGHVFLNELYDMLGLSRSREGVTGGWEKNQLHFINFDYENYAEKARGDSFELEFEFHEDIRDALPEELIKA